MAFVQAALSYADNRLSKFVAELAEFIQFPSIGTDDCYQKQTAACVNWLAKHLGQIGLQPVQVFRTPKHPLVYAEWIKQPNKPTLLIYGHYDVQPIEPIGEWIFSPFKPFARDNYIYGRGASDDKGQLFTHVKALEAFLKTYQ